MPKCTYPKAGELTERIDIEQESASVDAAGQEVASWTQFATGLRAKFRGMGGSEMARSGQTTALGKGVFTIRYRSGITPQMRVVHDSTNWNIEAINDPTGERRVLELICTKDAG